jgi:hypothetical protein
MICAIDFGSCWIRSVFRNPTISDRLTMYAEKAEYAVVADTEQHKQTLLDQQIPFAECEGSLVVAGNAAVNARWLSRVPCAPLFADGIVPSDDPPARQILGLLTEAILPPPRGKQNLCAVTVPGLQDGSARAIRNEEFLCRLVRMRGYKPLIVAPAEAAMLAAGNDASFTGISIVMGAETTNIAVARYGSILACETLEIGSNWIDSEIARQFQVQVWDESGNTYLDLDSIRQWKVKTEIHLGAAIGDRERMMSRLYSVVLDRVSRTVALLLASAPVRNALPRPGLSVILAGGATQADGFINLLTDRFIEHEIADKILSIRLAQDPMTAVVRGGLIFGELEARSLPFEKVA